MELSHETMYKYSQFKQEKYSPYPIVQHNYHLNVLLRLACIMALLK